MKIKKDGSVLNVTKGAYDTLFADMGYVPAGSGSKAGKRKNKQNGTKFMTPQPDKEVHEVKPSDDIPFANLSAESEPEEIEDDEDYEILLSEMTVKELVEYADENDIDLDGATRKDDIITVIKRTMEG